MALVVDIAGRIGRTFQVGDVQRYLAVFAIGILALFYVATKPSRPERAGGEDRRHHRRGRRQQGRARRAGR